MTDNPVTHAWVKVTERMPPSGQIVLVCYTNRAERIRRIRAQWIAAKTSEAHSEAEFCDYDEATDTFYTPEGWYECIDNWNDYSSVAVCEGEVTHWMPLPPDPSYTDIVSDGGLDPRNKLQREWVGLTDEEIWRDDGIMAANSGYGATFETLRELARAIEAKLKDTNI